MNQNFKSALVATGILICLIITTGFSAQSAFSQSDMLQARLVRTVQTNYMAPAELDTVYETTVVTKDKVQTLIEEEQKRQEEKRRAAEEQAQREAEALASAEAVSAGAGELELLAALIFCEAGNQPYEGQVAVGAVVMNRVRSGSYPDTITEVIYQPGQFTPAMTGWLDSVLASGGYTDTALQAARDALAGVNPIGDCLYFGCGSYGILIGDHYFH